jgi:hypothetical protein
LIWPGNPLSGAPQSGQVLAASTGGWTGAVPTSFTYQFYRCDSSGSSCVSVAGPTSGSTYTVASSDVGSTLQVTIRATNQYGIGSAQSASSAVVGGGTSTPPPSSDTSSPSVFLAAPSSGATVSGNVNVSATASDNVGVTKVEFSADDTVFATVNSTPYSAIWNTSGLSASSSHSLVVKAYDAAGNVGVSAVVTVTVAGSGDTQAPSVTISKPANGTTVSGNTLISATASDNVGVTSMKLYIDGSLRASSTSGTLNYTWKVNRGLKAGTHTILVQAYDAMGNLGQSTITISK